MWMIKNILLQILIVYLNLIAQSRCLRDVRVIIPAAVRRGEQAELRCQFDIESDLLYSVKWYKGGQEFYRFMPKEKPVMKVFPAAGINVVKKHSNASVVTLSDVEAIAAGRYSCEVSADAPSFLTYMVAGVMDVVDVPTHRPVIKIGKPRYRPGSVLRGNCTSNFSRPAANLTWYINGHQANPSYVKRHKSPEYTNEEGLQIAVVGIHFLVTPQHFHTGKLKIRCTASMYGVYWQSTEKSIEEEKTRPGPGNNGIGRGGDNSIGGGGVPPESQHVALMYPVQGTAYDPDPPPSIRDSAHALGGAQRTQTNMCAVGVFSVVLVELLRHFLVCESYNVR